MSQVRPSPTRALTDTSPPPLSGKRERGQSLSQQMRKNADGPRWGECRDRDAGATSSPEWSLETNSVVIAVRQRHRTAVQSVETGAFDPFRADKQSLGNKREAIQSVTRAEPHIGNVLTRGGPLHQRRASSALTGGLRQARPVG